MRCSRCRGKAVVSQRYSGLALCERHLREDVEAKARREIRAEGGVRPGDRMAIVFSVGESPALARFLLRTFGERRDMSFVALAPDGGEPGGEAEARFVGLEWIPLPDGNTERSLETAALGAGATVLVRADCLEDLAGRVLARVMRGEMPSGDRAPALRTLTPFRRVPRDEIRLYAEAIGARWEDAPAGAAGDDQEQLAGALLAGHAARHPSAPYSLLRLWDSLEGTGTGETD